MNNIAGAVFREVQHFRQWWLIALLAVMSLFFFYIAFQQLIIGEPFGNKPAPDWLVVVLVVLFGIGLPLMMFSAKLVTEVRSDGLYLKFFPFHFKPRRFPYHSIADCKACEYRPIKEYGGWGIRYGRDGRAYNVSGNEGVQLEFTNGKRLLIGSQKAKQLANAINGMLPAR